MTSKKFATRIRSHLEYTVYTVQGGSPHLENEAECP